MISFPRIFRPGCVVTIAGQIIDAAQLVATQPRVSFRVERSLVSEPDSAEVQVWGLSPARRSLIAAVFAEVGFAPMAIAAGYDRVTVPLFTGDVRRLEPGTLGSATVPLVCSGDDCGDAIADAIVPASLASTIGFNAKNMIDAAILSMAQPEINPSTAQVVRPGTVIVPHPSVAAMIASAIPGAVTTTYTFVNVGKARDLLDEAARLLQCRWWIRDRQLFMARRGLPVDALAVGLYRKHWLTEPTDAGDGLINVSTFLDPNLMPGRQVVLFGRVVPLQPEPFRIERGTYSGDSYGDSPWRADLVLRRIAAGAVSGG